jgi:hypothetical protein
MRLTARFPATAPAQPLLEGAVEVTGPVSGIGPQAVDVYLTHDGRITTTPIAQDAIGVRWDLSEDETSIVPAFVGPLEPGVYALHVRVTITPDDGPPQTYAGGPWPLEVLSP